MIKWGDFIFGIVVSIYVTSLVCQWASNSSWEQVIVDKGCGYYHPETAAFTWKNNRRE